jgi:hypothetical protein
MKKCLIIIPVILLLLAGCVTFSGKMEQDLKTGVYGAKRSLEVGRIDLADGYINQTARLVPPPKKLPDVKPFLVPKKTTRTVITVNGAVTNTVIEYITNIVTKTSGPTIITNQPDMSAYIVVPQYLKDMDVLVVDSDTYNNILNENKDLKKQVEKEKGALVKFEASVNETLRLKDEEMAKNAAELKKAKSWWGFWRKISWLSLIVPLGIIGLIAACVFNPAIIPIVVKVFGQIIEIAGRLVGAVVNFVNYIIKLITRGNPS